jgi:chemosensory pili system protein ChpE
MSLFVAAFALGLIFNAAPGAVFAETLRQGMHGGFRPALAVQVGSLVGDATWAVLGLVGVGLLLQAEALRVPVGVAGALYLAWLAVDSWRSARHVGANAAPNTAQASRRALRSGVLLSLTNPQNVAYWAALGSALGAVGVSAPGPVDYAVFFAGFMASSVVWAVVCAWGVAHLHRLAGPGWVRLTYRVCALAFLLLALASMRDLFTARPTAVARAAAPAVAATP